MTRTRTIIEGAVLILAAIAPLSGPAEALNSVDIQYYTSICTSYAKNATSLAQQIDGMGCYKGDATLSTSYDAHFNFCFQGYADGEMDGGFLDWENAKRQALVKSCKYCNSQWTPPGRDSFIKASTDRISQANAFCPKLDFKAQPSDLAPVGSSASWSDNINDRIQACLAIPLGNPGELKDGSRVGTILPQSADVVEAELENMVAGNCKANADCEDYATKAVQVALWKANYQFETCFAKQMPYLSSRWSLNWQAHYNWCTQLLDPTHLVERSMTVNQANSLIASEQEERIAAVDQCNGEHNRGIINTEGVELP
jgi:hypothetical protein